MKNEVTLTDDELSVLMASLELTIMSYEKYIAQHGEITMDFLNRKAYREAKNLHVRLKRIYF